MEIDKVIVTSSITFESLDHRIALIVICRMIVCCIIVFAMECHSMIIKFSEFSD